MKSWPSLRKRCNAGHLILCAVLLLMQQTAHAQDQYCFEQAASYYQVPTDLLRAIALHESSMTPGLEHRNTNGSIDIGLMQINEWWIPRLKPLGITRQDLYDPCVNTFVGAWILAQNMTQTMNIWEAVGAYNAGWKNTPERKQRRRKYISGIKEKLNQLRLRVSEEQNS